MIMWRCTITASESDRREGYREGLSEDVFSNPHHQGQRELISEEGKNTPSNGATCKTEEEGS